MKTEHLLIMRFSSMGEVAMLVPVVSSLARQYPDLRITILSQPFARDLFDGIAHNVGFMEADLGSEYRGVKGMNALYRRLVAKNFTSIADMHNILRSSYLRMRFNLSHYRVEHIDRMKRERRMLVAQTDKKLAPLPSLFDCYADVLARLGYPVKPDFKSVFPSAGGNLRLVGGSIGEKKMFQQWIGVAPFAAYAGKTYPPELTEAVVAEMVRRHPSCRIFIFGTDDAHMRIADEWCGKYKNCTNASALLGSVRQKLILMSHLDVMLSMDSADMHLAAIAGVRVVSVWGPTHPYAGGMGWNQRYDDVLQADMPCRPCSILGNTPCQRGDNACMSAIAPSAIVDRMESALTANKG